MNDLISRKAAINAVKDALNPSIVSFVKAKIALEQLSSAQPDQRWIPCSERLPDKEGVYLVTDHKGDVVRYVFNDTESSREYWKRCAVAWMPLPQPWKGEANEHNN